MKVDEIKNILNAKHKGTFVRVGWQKDVQSKSAEKAGIKVTKVTITTARWGVKYDNLQKVKLAKEEAKLFGSETKREYTPWYKHSADASYILEKLSDVSQTYLQLFTVKKNNTKVKYYINGVEKTKQEVIDSGYVNNSEFNKSQECLVFTIPTQNINFIGKEI